ncbi:uncharacterized protein PG998_008080 [Apiospora kogelbergensis]|uniref:uncharacterized protein n=1 Tax=Apiospora kogelbergensis TaxID=1337665 RepID=UPI0031313239
MGKKRRATAMTDGGNNAEGSKRPRTDHKCEARETMVLDPEGDVTITINCPQCDEPRSFQASSQVLRLASPVFSKMLGPNFREGQQLQNDGRVTITLHDDDPEATKMILCALHHHPDTSKISISHELLVPMAMFSDKYDCSRALSPWVPHWCKMFSRSGLEIGSLLIAAYLFRAFNFDEISKNIAMHMCPFFKTSFEVLRHIANLRAMALSRALLIYDPRRDLCKDHSRLQQL